MMKATRILRYALLLVLISGRVPSVSPWGIENEIISYVTYNRRAKGLSDVQHSEALSRAAYDYSIQMREVNKQSHSLSLPSEKLTRITAYAEQLREIEKLAGLYIVENLHIRVMGDPETLSHTFDNSPPHAKAVYHKNAVYMGWGVAFDDNNVYYVTLYVAIGGIHDWAEE